MFRWTNTLQNSRQSRRSQNQLNRARRLSRLWLQALEGRDVPSVWTPGPESQLPVHAGAPAGGGIGPMSVSPVGFIPSQIRHAYGFDSIGFGSLAGTGAGQTIAIIDWFDDPAFVSSTNANFNNSDLHKFDVALGIPDPPSFTKLDENGGTNYPAPNVSTATEIALDVEWAHALAPSANIVLVEANSGVLYDIYTNNPSQYYGPDDLGKAINTAKSLPGVTVVSMSFGASEGASDLGANVLFTTPNGHQPITFLASTGDSGAPGGYPAFSTNVVAVGGTALNLTGGGDYSSETGWPGSGGGISQFQPKPSYQGTENKSSTNRTIPDVAFDGSNLSRVAVYDSFTNGAASPWYDYGVFGTSVSCPCFAAIVAIANQGRAYFGQTSLSGTGDTLPRFYGYSPGVIPSLEFHDIASGNNGFAAASGYDLVTGWGTPYADRVVGELINDTTPPNAGVSPANVTISGGTTYSLAVSFVDNVAINPATLAGAVHVTGPNGFSVSPTLSSVTTDIGSQRIATYTFTPPNDSWDSRANGTYTISINQYTAEDYHYNSVPAGTIGTFAVNIPSTFYVTNANDSGAGSLRQAILDADNVGFNHSLNVISFDFNYFLTPRLITMAGGPMSITVPLVVQGPGANRLTVSGNGNRIFDALSAPTGASIAIGGMTLTGAKGANGEVLYAGHQVITLNSVTVTGDTASAGDAVSVLFGGTLTVTDSAFTDNVGAAVAVSGAGGRLTLQRCAISGNAGPTGAGVSGGGDYLLVDSCTVSGNSTFNSGGGIAVITGTGIIRNSTVSGNSATNFGGGVYLHSNATSLLVQNSTITANSAISNNGGGGIGRFGGNATVTIESCAVSGNSNTGGPDIFSTGTVNVNFSAIGSNTGFTLTGANNLAFGANLQLGSLANNGGPTLTCLPAQNSPLINKGSNTANLSYDQRGGGYTRVLTGQPDIGAIEVPVLLVTNANDSGLGSLRQAIADQNQQQSLGTINFDPTFFSVPRTITLTSGVLSIQNAVNIAGPGSNILTVSGGNVSEVFQTTNGAGAGALIYLSGMTISDGSTNGGGAGVFNNSATLTMTNCTITGNTASYVGGGGIFSNGPLDLESCIITGNAVSNTGLGNCLGGGVYCGAALMINNCTIAGNSTKAGGGGVGEHAGSVLVQNSTISGNSATIGGGVYFFATTAFTTLTVRNSTIAGNISSQSGGGIAAAVDGTILVQNSTVTANTATSGFGGGIARASGLTFMTIISSVVAANTNANAPDLFTAGSVSATFDAFGSKTGVTTFIGDATTNSLLGQNFKLGSLASNGGTTKTVALLAGSPCINAGSNPANLTTDQRGTGFPRVTNGAIDIGAFEADATPPTASGSFAGITVPGGTTYYLTVTYADNVAVSLASLDGNDIRITRTSGPNNGYAAFSVLGSYFGTTGPLGDTTPLGAVYLFTPPGGAWDANDNGAYAVSVEPNQVADTSGNFAVSKSIGNISINIADTTGPTYNGILPNVILPGATNYPVQVVFTDDVSVSEATVPNATLVVAGPHGFTYYPSYVSDNSGGQDKSPITANYSMTPPGGSWDAADNGAYNVFLVNGVSDTSGNASSTGLLGTFTVNIPDTTPPTANVNLNNVYGPGGTSYPFTVTFNDDTAVDLTTVTNNSNVIRIVGPGAPTPFNVLATFVSETHTADLSTVFGNYTFTPPGGSWQTMANGTYYVSLEPNQIKDVTGNVSPSVPLGSFTVDATPLTTVQSVVINGGDVQRSRLTRIVVNFSSPVTYSSGVGFSPFRLFRQGSSAGDVNVKVFPQNPNAANPTTSATLTFMSGPDVENGSLADGRYNLMVGVGTGIKNLQSVLIDAAGNGQAGSVLQIIGDPATNTLFRLFGDITGDGAVGTNDFVFFRQAYNGVNDAFDFDADGFVSTNDFVQFRNRFNSSI
jgi:Right handed beta helix region